MIKVTSTVSPFLYKLSLTGHAGYDKSGNDIVCASISVLVQTLAYASLEEGFVVEHIDLTSGRASIHIPIEQENEIATAQLETLWNAILLGIEQIARQYPKYVEYKAVG